MSDIKTRLIEETRRCIKNSSSISFSLNEVLEKTQISKGSFYHHFGSKDELIYHTIAPVIRNHEKILREKILQSKNLKERLYIVYGVFLDKTMEKELINIEKMYKYLFFDNKIGKSKALWQLYIEGRTARQVMLFESIKLANIKATKEVKLMVEYLTDTTIFYSMLHRHLFKKVPRKEIMSLIDIICETIETKKRNKHEKNSI